MAKLCKHKSRGRHSDHRMFDSSLLYQCHSPSFFLVCRLLNQSHKHTDKNTNPRHSNDCHSVYYR